MLLVTKNIGLQGHCSALSKTRILSLKSFRKKDLMSI